MSEPEGPLEAFWRAEYDALPMKELKAELARARQRAERAEAVAAGRAPDGYPQFMRSLLEESNRERDAARASARQLRDVEHSYYGLHGSGNDRCPRCMLLASPEVRAL